MKLHEFDYNLIAAFLLVAVGVTLVSVVVLDLLGPSPEVERPPANGGERKSVAPLPNSVFRPIAKYDVMQAARRVR